ncbi:type VII secretion protein EccB [Nocardioides sp.]|uniref:type VII secretion protein EccB n=1 Tax=Nocardioides sp. TaxID=35761 RepID=UPI00271E233A|nr:type VII secretion protein EccB [Nocardioides sp.]MDO9457850.1 type VII secretion protein EccB [Nocardioides sp.]
MATKKDLVEAYSFSRRRLVTAFVSGAPGGREVEPSRPGRAVVGGLALAVLLVAAGAVLGILKSPTSIDWGEEGLVSEKESGAVYLNLLKPDGSGDNELRPLANITSAMLIFGSGVRADRVPHDEIADQDPGAPIGILGAPQTPPDPDKLVQTGWTACLGVVTGAEEPTGVKVELRAEPAVTDDPGLVTAVETSSGVFVVAQSANGGYERGERAYAYPVPGKAGRGRLLQALTGEGSPARVPDTWVTLFPAGGDLALSSFGIPDDRFGTAPDVDPGAPGARVGDQLLVDDDVYLVTPDRVVELDAFATAVFRGLEYPARKESERITLDQAPASVMTTRDLPDAARWPTEVRDTRPVGQLCARLDVEADKPGVVLATADDLSTASAAEVDFGDTEIAVESGRGAFVYSGDWEEGGDTSGFLVDPRGLAYPVGPGQERDQLGYGPDVVPDVVVPNAWIELLPAGVPLTIDAARCPPTSDQESTCS